MFYGNLCHHFCNAFCMFFLFFSFFWLPNNDARLYVFQLFWLNTFFYHFINCLVDERKQNVCIKILLFWWTMSTFYHASLAYPSVQYHHRTGTVTNISVLFILLSWHMWRKCITLSDTLTWHSRGLHRQYFYNFVHIKAV